MNTQLNAVTESQIGPEAGTMAAIPGWRRIYWSVRRELWEYRSIYLAPLAVAGVAVTAFSISVILGIWEPPLRLNPERPVAPFDSAAALLMATCILVSVFYCLDALHGERRDRSILFWKSLPVSDLNVVLAKASIPLVILPLITFAVTVAMQWLMLLVGSAAVAVRGMSVSTLWAQLDPLRMWGLLLYHLLTAHALWPAPVYCWLLLVSGWARRTAFLWAALPVLAVAGVEGILFHSSHFIRVVLSHLVGLAQTAAMAGGRAFPTDAMTRITPGRYLATPGLWIGLMLAALFLAAAVRLRRSTGPI